MANSEAQASKKVVVGLGNPGKEYENTYHNVGWLALAKIMNDGGTGWRKYKNFFEYIEDGTRDVVFIRPLTYMNESGKAAREALKKYNTTPASLVIFHDDSDLTVGNYKISFARNSAGHKGVQSIIDALKTNGFVRVRIGIRPAREARRQKAGEFALKQISTSHKKILSGIFSAIDKDLNRQVFTAHTQTSS